MASATCSEWMFSAWSRSAMVRDCLIMRWQARGDRNNCSAACSSNIRLSPSRGQSLFRSPLSINALGLPARCNCILREAMTRSRTVAESSPSPTGSLRMDFSGRETSTWTSIRSRGWSELYAMLGYSKSSLIFPAILNRNMWAKCVPIPASGRKWPRPGNGGALESVARTCSLSADSGNH